MTKTIGLFVNTTKENAKQVVTDVITLLKRKEVQPLIPNEQALHLGLTQTGISTEQMVDESELVIVLGGDGTLLSAAHTTNIENVPILAITSVISVSLQMRQYMISYQH